MAAVLTRICDRHVSASMKVAEATGSLLSVTRN
jgi:hypothetical protein